MNYIWTVTEEAECGITGTNTKGKATRYYELKYLLVYSGKEKNEYAKEGVGRVIHKNYKRYIDNIIYTSQTILSSLLLPYMIPILISQEWTGKTLRGIRKRIRFMS